MSVLLFGNFGHDRKHWRIARVPTPSSQATTLVLGHGCESDGGSDSEAEHLDERVCL